MYRVELTEAQQQELHQRTHQKNVPLRTRDRLEMVRLCGMGWKVSQIAPHLHQVRYWIKAFLKGSFDALEDRPHPGQKSAVTPEMLAEVNAWITLVERTWNARQVAAEVYARYGILRSLDQWRRLLRNQRLSYKRTQRSLHHKQDLEQVAQKTKEIDLLKRGLTADN